jgi:hypothetical protein
MRAEINNLKTGIKKKMVEELSELNEFIKRQPTNFTLPNTGPTMIG